MNTIWHAGTGKIKYDPHRFGMKKRTTWWAIANIDKEITRYYRWWIKNQYWVDLCQPSWDAHISIIRGEQPKDELKHLWKKYDGQKVKFEYGHNVHKNGHYWVIDVKSIKLTQIRQEFNFPSNWNFHITIGRTYY